LGQIDELNVETTMALLPGNGTRPRTWTDATRAGAPMTMLSVGFDMMKLVSFAAM